MKLRQNKMKVITISSIDTSTIIATLPKVTISTVASTNQRRQFWAQVAQFNPSTSSNSSTQHLVAMFLAMFTTPSLCRLLISCTWFSPFAFAHTCVLDVRLLRQMCDDARRCKMHQIGVKTARINQQAASLSWGLEQSHSQIAVFFVDC